jgi:hypothetical protein
MSINPFAHPPDAEIVRLHDSVTDEAYAGPRT